MKNAAAAETMIEFSHQRRNDESTWLLLLWSTTVLWMICVKLLIVKCVGR